jgi:hypothetical protein
MKMSLWRNMTFLSETSILTNNLRTSRDRNACDDRVNISVVFGNSALTAGTLAGENWCGM